jgi:hypothetical protein
MLSPGRTRSRVVQGEGTRTLELTALRRPFLCFRCRATASKEVAVAGRLVRHGAGARMTFSQTTSDALASSVAGLIGHDPNYPPIACDGARRVAEATLRLAGVPGIS